MKNIFKRIVASLLVAVMLFGSAPIECLTGIDFDSLFAIEAEAAINKNGEPISGYYNTYYSNQEDWLDKDVGSVKIAWPVLPENNVDNKSFSLKYYKQVNSPLVYREKYGKVHSGIDIYAKIGTVVSAVADGTIVKMSKWSSGNIYVCIRHDNLYEFNGKTTVYSEYVHLSGFYEGVKEGDFVAAGQPIAYSGNTGGVAAHLHFSMYRSVNNDFTSNNYINNNTNTGTEEGYKYEQGVFSYAYTKAEIDPYYAQVNWKTKDKYYYVTGNNGAAIRSQPLNGDNSVGRMNKGDKFIVLGEVYVKETKHTWYYAEFTDSAGKVTKGYVYSDYVTKSKESIPVAMLARAYEDSKSTVRPLDGRLHKKGESFRILGNIKSYKDNMAGIIAKTVKYNTSTGAYDIPVCESSVSINTKNYTLTKSSGSNDKKSINTNLIFKGLDVGHYRFMLIVDYGTTCTMIDDAYFEVSDKITKSQDGQASKPAKVNSASILSQLGEWATSKAKSIVSNILTPKNELVDVSNLIAYADIPDDPNSGVGSGGTGSGGTGSGSSSSGGSTSSAPVSNGYKLGVYRTTSADRLNIRKGPGTSYGFATTAIPKSTEIAVYEVSSNGWGKTKYNGVEGWVSMNFCTYVRELETVQKPEAPTVKLSTDANVPTGAIVSATWLGVSDADSYTAYLKNSNDAVVATQDGIKGYSASFAVKDAGVYTITVSAVNSKYSTESAPTAAFAVHAPLTVSFVDWDGRTETRTVPYGGAAIAPDAPTREGYDFTGWDTNYNKVTENITVKATYKIKTFTVKFLDRDGNLLEKAQRIDYGSSATPPSNTNPTTGWSFIGWDTNAWECVKENLVVKAVYAWTNKDLPVVVSNVTADLISGGYSVNYELTCTDSVTNGRAVIALKTSEGKLITTTESDAFSLSSDSRNVPKNTYVPEPEDNSPASVVEVYIVKSFANAIPISEKATGSVDLHLQWSEWSTTKPADNLYEDVDSRVEYRYRDKKITTSTSKNLSGWTRYNTTSWQQSGSTTNTTYAHNSDAMVRTVSTRVVTTPVYKTQYKYTHYRDPSKYTVWPYLKSGFHFHETGWLDSPYSFNDYSSLGTQYPKYSNGGKACEIKVNGTKCGCTHWYNQQTRQVVDYNIYTTWYDWTETYYTYYFWQWGSYSSWSTSYVAANNDRQVETRTLYRYKNSSTGATENTSGEVRTFSGNIDSKYAGEQATLFIYKITEASDWTGEFVGQTKIADDGSYSFTFKLREEPTVETGDFTVILGVEGCDKTMVVGTIEAPKPEYKVTFYDWDGSIVDQQTVTEGGTASVPESPVREGYRFTGWDASLTNIGMDMELTARYIQNEYTVVFVDWTNKVVLTKQFMHGDYLVPPELTVPEGYKHTGWENVTLGETVVTSNMVLTAEFEKLTYEVSFYDFDNNLITTQTVEYGETPNFVDVPEKDNHIFTEWVSADNTTDNISGRITLYPSYVFAETVADPVASVANGTYGEAQTVELTCETDGAVIYYTLDGTDPTEGGMEYTGPITIDRSTELKFCAYAFEKNDSEVVTNYYAINTGNTVSGWMLQEDIPDYVTNDADTYKLEYEVGYRFKDIVATSSYSNILALENEGWTNNGFEYGEWSDWLIYEPNLEDMAYEVESQQPAPEEELRYLYTRFKYADAETGEYKYTYQEIEGIEGEWEEYLTPLKLSVAGYVSGTQVKYYEVDGEKWYNQSLTTVEVVPDYLMYRYRTKEYTLTKWTSWTTDAPAEGEMRETEKDTVYRYFIPEMYVVSIVPDYSKFGTETITFIVEANELIEIDEADYQYLGHDFVGFYTDTEFTNYWNHKTETVTSELTLYPKYKAHSFEVIFVDYDGTVLSEETVEYGESALAPDVGERDGYVFIGWDTDNLDYVTETMIVTAQYVTEDEYCKVSLSHSRYNLMVGTSFTLVATITPENAENKNLNWYTDDTNVAVVNDEGVVTGVNAGVAIVTVEAEATGEMVECLVTVSENPSESLCLIPGSKLGLDEENGLLRGVSNTDCTVEAIKAEFMNADLVFTDKNGNILEDTALVGTGTVISFSNGGKVIDEVTVVVTGDMTGDGLVNNRDAAMITRYLVEKETADFAQMVAIDVNGDGYINNRDASMVSRYLVGKETI